MNRKAWRPYYLKNGKYNDGRDRLMIAWFSDEGIRKIIVLPKPEVLKDILIRERVTVTSSNNLTEKTIKKGDSIAVH